MRIDFHPLARQELADAATYYEGLVTGLGVDFVTEVERVATILLDHHLLGERLDKLHRRVPLRRFPFALIYRAQDDSVRIIAVAHRRRQPRYWKPRVHDR